MVWPWRGWVWTRRALTEIPQAVLTGVHAHVQHAHQPKVVHLGQGLLQKPTGSQPWGQDSGHAPPVTPLPLASVLEPVADTSLPCPG